MGVNRYLRKDATDMADLGRTHLFRTSLDYDEIMAFKMYLCARMVWPDDPHKCMAAVNEFDDHLDNFIEDCIKLGRIDVCDSCVESGLTIVDE